MAAKEFLDRWIGRAVNAATMWTLIPATAVGVVTGYLSQGVAWIDQFGAFGWWSAGLLGFLVAALGLALAGIGREKWAIARATRKWAGQVDDINPLDTEFHKKRIRLVDLAHPITFKIKGKRFIDCQLVGPANLVLLSGINLNSNTFTKCDFVPTKKELYVLNAIGLEDCEVIGGEILETVLFVHPDIVALLEGSGSAPFYVSITGDEAIDARRPK